MLARVGSPSSITDGPMVGAPCRTGAGRLRTSVSGTMALLVGRTAAGSRTLRPAISALGTRNAVQARAAAAGVAT